MLASHSNRWLSAYFRFNVRFDVDNEVMEKIYLTLDPIKGNLPILRHLVFNIDCSPSQTYPARLEVFQDAPNLRSFGLSMDTSRIRLPWRQLKHLGCEVGFWSNWQNEGWYCHLLAVESFSLALGSFEDIDLLAKFTFPRLTSLTLSTSDDAYRYLDINTQLTTLVQVASFVSRSSCTLTSFEWINLPVEIAAFMSFLKTIPSLVNLSIKEGGSDDSDDLITDVFFETLRVSSSTTGNDPFLPHLRNLTLFIEAGNFTAQSFVGGAIKSRWLPDGDRVDVKCLRTVRLDSTITLEYYFRFWSNRAALRSLVQAGMKIVIRGVPVDVCEVEFLVSHMYACLQF